MSKEMPGRLWIEHAESPDQVRFNAWATPSEEESDGTYYVPESALQASGERADAHGKIIRALVNDNGLGGIEELQPMITASLVKLSAAEERVRLIEGLIVERNIELMGAVENYCRINGLRNLAEERLVLAIEALNAAMQRFRELGCPDNGCEIEPILRCLAALRGDGK